MVIVLSGCKRFEGNDWLAGWVLVVEGEGLLLKCREVNLSSALILMIKKLGIIYCL
jgi:hypothetical protein